MHSLQLIKQIIKVELFGDMVYQEQIHALNHGFDLNALKTNVSC